MKQSRESSRSPGTASPGGSTKFVFPNGEESEDSFSCAYKNNKLFHGKLYLGKTLLAFKSVTGFSIMLYFSDVVKCLKRNTAFVFPK